MMKIIKDNCDGSMKSVKIKDNGVKEGFRINLNGPDGKSNNASIEGRHGQNYVITPAGAGVGENIAINDSGLYIRAKNNKKQLITATSCPDNQVKVQVGQGKSAVQLSIQVAPQGKRGEVELNCVRNETENGGTGYTVSVNREGNDAELCSSKKLEEDSTAAAVSAYDHDHDHDGQKENIPRGILQAPCIARSQTLQLPSSAYNILTPLQQVEGKAKDQNYHQNHLQAYASSLSQNCSSKDLSFETKCQFETPVITRLRQESQSNEDNNKKCLKLPTAASTTVPAAGKKDKAEFDYERQALRNIYLHRERLLNAELERCLDNREEDHPSQNWLYKRKLDLHHHKPTISYLIGRRTTALFKEIRKATDGHPPAPPSIKF